MASRAGLYPASPTSLPSVLVGEAKPRRLGLLRNAAPILLGSGSESEKGMLLIESEERVEEREERREGDGIEGTETALDADVIELVVALEAFLE